MTVYGCPIVEIVINPLVTRQKILSDLAEIYSVDSLYCP